jgi:hypothetical protein
MFLPFHDYGRWPIVHEMRPNYRASTLPRRVSTGPVNQTSVFLVRRRPKTAEGGVRFDLPPSVSSLSTDCALPRQMPTGGEVRVIVHLLSGPTTGASASIYGEILRDKPQPDGRHGIAVAIKRHKFL